MLLKTTQKFAADEPDVFAYSLLMNLINTSL